MQSGSLGKDDGRSCPRMVATGNSGRGPGLGAPRGLGAVAKVVGGAHLPVAPDVLDLYLS